MDVVERVYGWDYSFTPVKPIDPDWRQTFAQAQLEYLARWVPLPGEWVQ